MFFVPDLLDPCLSGQSPDPIDPLPLTPQQWLELAGQQYPDPLGVDLWCLAMAQIIHAVALADAEGADGATIGESTAALRVRVTAALALADRAAADERYS